MTAEILEGLKDGRVDLLVIIVGDHVRDRTARFDGVAQDQMKLFNVVDDDVRVRLHGDLVVRVVLKEPRSGGQEIMLAKALAHEIGGQGVCDLVDSENGASVLKET